jgi:hypothetical protein
MLIVLEGAQPAGSSTFGVDEHLRQELAGQATVVSRCHGLSI